ncbi:D-cysteine desulfhydrase family protein [Burkholderia pseudomallei]|uniref:D-cysteine desulfhydrase family protein n=1 Tax=Burkholderia pseudomallei TaxID=28450 RepID=UPI000F06B39A|nr:D-cysteine desulfhydrase family protein [Burkholderia pseudomallei]VBF56118.1 D-cysteine desulfhydrase [Burkholderia pseudomallei]
MNTTTLSTKLNAFARLNLIDAPTPLQYLPRLSAHVGRDIHVKRDDCTPLAMGGNKLRKLEFLAADALGQNADVLVTAGAIQSNHVRQTAALAAQLGLGCVALLENPIAAARDDYLQSGNRLLLDLFDVRAHVVDGLDDVDRQLEAAARRLRDEGRRPYVIPIGGSNPLGALGYVRAGLAFALAHALPGLPVIGVTVSRTDAQQRPKVRHLLDGMSGLLDVALPAGARIDLWDDYFAPRYGEPNRAGIDALRLLARTEGLLLDPVYTGKAMAGLIDGVARGRFDGNGPVLFVHTGGAPALFAYQDACRASR